MKIVNNNEVELHLEFLGEMKVLAVEYYEDDPSEYTTTLIGLIDDHIEQTIETEAFSEGDHEAIVDAVNLC